MLNSFHWEAILSWYSNRKAIILNLTNGYRCLTLCFTFSPQDIFSFYSLPTASLPVPDSNHHPTSLPEGVQFVLNTLPVRYIYVQPLQRKAYCQHQVSKQSLASTLLIIASSLATIVRSITRALEMVMALLLMLTQQIQGSQQMCHRKCMRWWLQ